MMETQNPSRAADYKASTWKHGLTVAGTMIVAFSTIMLGLPFSKLMGFEINEMAAEHFSPSFAKVSLLLMLALTYFLVVGLSQRYIHKAPFRQLGFAVPVFKHILVAFAIGVAINLVPFLMIVLSAKNMVYASAIPAGTALITVVAAYAFFVLVWLTVNSIGEELIFRCYPLEHFIGRPRLLPYVILCAAIIFALLHFIVRAPSLPAFFSLSLTSIFYSVIYLNWRSIWVLVGIHNGMNFINLTFSENWKMGGLFTWNGDPVPWLGIYVNIYQYTVPIVAIVFLVLRYRRRQLTA